MSVFFPEFVQAQKSQYKGTEVVAAYDEKTTGLKAARREIPGVLGKGWNAGGWTAEKLLTLSKDNRFSARAKAALERLATHALDSVSNAPKIAMADAQLTAKELEGVLRDFSAERPKVVTNAETVAQVEFVKDGFELDQAFLKCVKSTMDLIASAQAPVPSARVD